MSKKVFWDVNPRHWVLDVSEDQFMFISKGQPDTEGITRPRNVRKHSPKTQRRVQEENIKLATLILFLNFNAKNFIENGQMEDHTLRE
jgi:hypothetical protein